MKVNQAYRYELKPNNKQVGLLVKHCGAARFAWNWGLARRIELFEQNEGKDRFTNAMEQHRELNRLKRTDFPWMYEVSKCAPQESLRDLDRAFANMWKAKAEGYYVGFPKFKKKNKDDSFRLTGSIHVYPNSITLPKLGNIRTKENTSKLKGRILSATVSREADRWFVSLSVERERDITPQSNGEVVGIDLGINRFATIYNGTNTQHIESPKPLNRSLKRLKRASKKHSRKQNGSNNKRKSARRLARLHRRIRNQRKDFLHKLTTSLAKTKSAICIEDLNVKGMAQNKHLARSVADAGWREFRRMLEYKTAWYGSHLAVIDRFEATSKTCSACGVVNENLRLNDRTWICMSCGTFHDRDENASVNIRSLGLNILVPGVPREFTPVETPLAAESADGGVYEPCVAEAGSKHTCNR